MEISIKIENEAISISSDSDAFDEIIYNLETEINLTKLVSAISEASKEIIINPNNFEEFAGTSQQSNQTLLKVVEYIYKIIERYNQCYRKIYEEENKESIA